MRGCCEAYLEESYEGMVAVLARQVPALHGLEVAGVLHVGLHEQEVVQPLPPRLPAVPVLLGNLRTPRLLLLWRDVLAAVEVLFHAVRDEVISRKDWRRSGYRLDR